MFNSLLSVSSPILSCLWFLRQLSSTAEGAALLDAGSVETWLCFHIANISRTCERNCWELGVFDKLVKHNKETQQFTTRILDKDEAWESFCLTGRTYYFISADHPEIDVLPLLPEGVAWYRLVDTALPFPAFISTSGEFVTEQTKGLFTYAMKSYSCTLFEASNGSTVAARC
ncbi:hypothetical protein RIF29_37753 [Crotalaria pallida]|uniref:Uncharacterized protein n=1 Tax=Crotalaria pallida TaxID=3830 RepID=A0AAN9HNA5_CROPI